MSRTAVLSIFLQSKSLAWPGWYPVLRCWEDSTVGVPKCTDRILTGGCYPRSSSGRTSPPPSWKLRVTVTNAA